VKHTLIAVALFALTAVAWGQPITILSESKPMQKLGTNNVLVILVRFIDSPATPFSQAQAQGEFSTVSNYFREVSFGLQTLNVTVTPWLQVNAVVTNCQTTAISNYGISAAVAADYNLTNYQNVAFVFPAMSGCLWSAAAGGGGSSWYSGRNTAPIYAHELGHNFGLGHAGSLRCSHGVITGICSSEIYGDLFDLMGHYSSMMHVSALNKSKLGWIPANTVATHSSGSTTYSLTPTELAGGSLYAVKIPVAAERTYWIEYRQPIGFDAEIASYPNNGAQVRVQFPYDTSLGMQEALLDMTPETATFADAALLVGRSYFDPVGDGVTISVMSASPTALMVQVSNGGGDGSRVGPPSITSPAPQSVLPGSSVMFTWSPNSAGAAVSEWWLYAGSSVGAQNYLDSGSLGSSLSRTVNLPTNGTPVYLRLWYRMQGAWKFVDASYTAASGGGGGTGQPAITSPSPNSVLPGSSATFAWSAGSAAVTEWWLYAGSSAGAQNYRDTGSLGTSLSTTVNRLPTNGTAVYIRLWFRIGSSWQYVDSVYQT
jgi:hypothetical protein